MAESTLQLTVSELRKAVMRFLGLNTSYQGLSQTTQDDVDLCVRGGLRRFYAPEPLPNETTSHQWSFLTPRATLTTEADTSAYDLPDDFAHMVGPLERAAGSRRLAINLTTDESIRRMESATSSTGEPRHAAVIAKVSDEDDPDSNPDIPTRWQLVLFPTPDGEYVLSYRYYVIADLANDTLGVPGGALHGDAIVASCLERAERLLNSRAAGRESDVRKREWLEALRASVLLDRRRTTPRTLGVMGDPSETSSASETVSVLYNGVQY